MDYIGQITKEVSSIPFHTTCNQVDQLFQEDQGLQGLVILKQNFSAGLITRTNFYQKMGTRYGYNLYFRKSIELIANNDPLVVDYFTSVIEVSKLAMDRKAEEIYDDVIVKKENKVYGVVSIKDLLLKVSNIQSEFASYLNPLTLLPGNKIIDEKLESTFRQQEKSTVLYIDLDRFKSYNDSYGFKKGDSLLQSTANLLKASLSNSEDFLGHIGGDDYIIILNHHDFEELCQRIIETFDQQILSFYSEEHLRSRTVYIENREGIMEDVPIVSLSIAVVKNQTGLFSSVEELVSEATRIKKVCKAKKESCFHAEPDIDYASY